MKEVEWVELMAARLTPALKDHTVEVQTGLKLAYGHEIKSYGKTEASHTSSLQTDLAIVEHIDAERWTPRVVVEAKLGSVTTHDAITYSEKAATHRSVHPYLRYGIMLGEREHHPLPGRLYRHGAQFDFMASFSGLEPTDLELTAFAEVLAAEIAASRTLERILYESRRPDRDRYTILHRRLIVK